MTTPELSIDADTACPRCDQLLKLSEHVSAGKASCPRCQGSLLRHTENAHSRTMAFASAGVVALLLALSYPFLGFSASGKTQSMTLLEAGSALSTTHEPVLGALVIATIILLPLATLVCLLSVACLLHLQKPHPSLPLLGRMLHEIEHWSMVEVFLIGVLVSLTKIAAMASISFGLSFWAFITFCILFVLANGSLDRLCMWRAIAELNR